MHQHQFTGNVLSNDRPRIDGRLPDGSRVHIIIPPLAPQISLAIRRFQQRHMAMEDLVASGALSHGAAHFLKVAVEMKQAFWSAAALDLEKPHSSMLCRSFVPRAERIISIEDVRELQLQQPHVVSLQTRPPMLRAAEVDTRDLLESSLLHASRPHFDWRGSRRQALDLLNALNSGHGGTMCSLHANSAANALSKLETLVLFAGEELPQRAIRKPNRKRREHCDSDVQASRRQPPTHGDHRNRLLPRRNRQLRPTPSSRSRLNLTTGRSVLRAGLEATGHLPFFFEQARSQGFDLTEEDFGRGDSTVS